MVGTALPAAPVNMAAPVLSGTPSVGQTLSCSQGAWTGFPSPTFSYQWLREGTPIVGSSAGTYVVQGADQGQELACQVTAMNSLGSESATSNTLQVSTAQAPVITGVTPEHGTPAGGAEVTITGTNFAGATAVKFGSNNATRFTVESDTKITATTPAFGGGAEDGVGVFVTTPGGTNTSEECGYPVGYRYEPTITTVEPSSGPADGGTHVTIRGAAFEGTQAGGGFLCSLLEPVAQGVKFGSKAATSWNIVSDTEISAVAPAGSGTVDVTIEGVVGTSPISSADRFSYSETQAEKEAWLKTFAEENARKVAEEAAIRMRHEEEATTAATRKHQEEAAAASHKQEEEVQAKNKKAKEAPDTGGVALAATSITVQSNGMALVKLNCLGITSCHGKLTLRAKNGARGKGKGNGKGNGKKALGAVTIGTVELLGLGR